MDLSIKCFVGQHQYWAYGLGLSAFCLWVLGIPLVVFLLLRKNIKTLTIMDIQGLSDEEALAAITIKTRYSFVFHGYKHEYYYWYVC